MTPRNGTRPRASGRTTPKKQTAAKRSPKLVELPPPVETTPAVAIEPPAGKLRLLKVAVQPTFVLVAEDGSVQEISHAAFEVKGVDWSSWSADVFTDDALEDLRKTITPITPT